MKAFMTTGTFLFLKGLIDKHPKVNFYFMNSSTSSLAYYEGEGKSVFASGRDFEIIIQSGNMKEEGFVVMNNIPVSDEGKPVFEDRFKQHKGDIDSMPGFQAFRLLKPLKGNTYIVFTQWASEQDFENWKTSDEFAKSHQNQAVRPPAYFAEKPFITSYTMVHSDDI